MSTLTTTAGAELTREVRVINRHGLHIRPATDLVRLVRTFRSDVTIAFGPECADARSIMSLLLLAAHRGAVLTITARGEDAAEALAQIDQLFSKGFGDFC